VALTDLSVIITGGKAKNFTIDKNECDGTLAAGKTCKVTIKFTPHESGQLTAILIVSYTDGGTNRPLNVNLKGVGK
jgi:hypothetical protein